MMSKWRPIETAPTAYRIKANGDAICSECDGDEASEFHASGQESL